MAVRKAAQKDQSQAAAKQTAPSATRLSRGPVDAPGKRHRKPLPQEPIDKRMGEPRGKQMGQARRAAGAAGDASTSQRARPVPPPTTPAPRFPSRHQSSQTIFVMQTPPGSVQRRLTGSSVQICAGASLSLSAFCAPLPAISESRVWPRVGHELR